MMDVYVSMPEEGFELCHPESQDDFETINLLVDGTPRERTWQPIRVRLIHEDGDLKLARSDAPWLGSHAPIFRQSVINKLGSALIQYGELLPLTCREADLFLFNTTRVLDALDDTASSITRFPNGRAMRVNRYVFREDVIADADIFKIPNLRVSPTFVSQRLVRSWVSADLQGLAFKKLWSAGTTS